MPETKIVIADQLFPFPKADGTTTDWIEQDGIIFCTTEKYEQLKTQLEFNKNLDMIFNCILEEENNES